MEAYLDHAATTPLKPIALDALIEASHVLGNPSGSHKVARRAKDLLEASRESVAELLGIDASGVVFTSGGTESDNLAIFGAGADHKVVLCSAIEHHGVLEPVTKRNGIAVGVTPDGVIDLDKLERDLSSRQGEVGLVSVMMVNNETGVIQPLDEVACLVRRYCPDALCHSDAVQAPSFLDMASLGKSFDLISLSGHKFGGPKGTGILAMRGNVKLDPVILGGGQERELRSGTQNLAGIVSMAAAFRDAVEQRDTNVAHVSALTARLRTGLKEIVGSVTLSGEGQPQICNITNYTFPGLNSEELLFLMDGRGVYASAGSSCASGAMNPSHVLLAMGRSRSQAKGSLRLSLGATTTQEEVDYSVEVIGAAVAELSEKKGILCI